MTDWQLWTLALLLVAVVGGLYGIMQQLDRIDKRLRDTARPMDVNGDDMTLVALGRIENELISINMALDDLKAIQASAVEE